MCFLGLVASLSGCATALVRQENPTKVDHPYPATVFDVQAFWVVGVGGEPPFTMADPEARNSTGERILYGAGSVFDLPFSIAFDTLLLPFDTIQLLRMPPQAPQPEARGAFSRLK